ncbi:Alpha chain of nascent polypeptide associated complex [Hibiscus syriacus]|uniref:Telomerase reverse transcriptase n=1 Tax=Hibiscus syriacus TaxID=106335 RepID=A0A6A3AWQ6_HIBSY|nr:Alpha chain of nascent polypeptide associated complex [Hibiscus syriacus]
MARKKKNRPGKEPIVLRKMYRDNVRSLATTITSIIYRPPRPFTCTLCEGISCLRCCEDPMAFLLRPDDPLDYISLLNDCFVVVNDDAPYLDFHPDQLWDQKKIVVRAIERSCQGSKPPNVIFSGYNKLNESSQIVECLTSSAWNILLGRVGDECMFYLLRHTSIFVPISDKKHLQVVGSPVKYTRNKSSKTVNIPQSGKKRKRTFGCKFPSNGEIQGSSIQTAEEHKPFSRPPKWKRGKRRQSLNIPECGDKSIVRTTCFYEDCLPRSLLCPINTYQTTVQCSCYLVLKAPHKVSNSVEINRQYMFYNLEDSSYVLPREHILNTLVPNFTSSKCLMENIFGLTEANLSNHSVACSHNVECGLAGSTCLYHSFLKLLKLLIRRTRRCNHLKLLNKYCPLPSSYRKTGKSRTIIEVSATDNMELKSTMPYCSKSQVVDFLWAVCRSLVPQDLLGTPSTRRSLKRNIFKFLQLRRFEKFSITQCMHQIKSTDFPFLSRFSLVSWILWFFSSLVVPLVQANFYVTEGERGKHTVFYYRKPVWRKFIDRAVTCLKDRSYREVGEDAVRAIIHRRPFGFSKLRICPKQNGVRMLTNLNTSSKMLQERTPKYRCSWMLKILKPRPRTYKTKRVSSVNFRLRGVHAVLKGLLLKEPEKLGSTVFDYNDVYKKLRPFITSLKNISTTMPGVYIVAADVSKAFDSVNQDKLLRMIEDVMVKNVYILQQNHQVAWFKKKLLDCQSLMLVDETVDPGWTNILSSASWRSLFGVVADQGCCSRILKRELFSDLHQLLKCNVLQLDSKFYLQKLGIPQGSILSTLLCSLYYGHMDKHVIFPYLERVTEALSSRLLPFNSSDAAIFPPAYLLLRFVDDFLFISTSKDLASDFLSMLCRGFSDYNCYMNEEKFCFNFDIENHFGILSNRLFTGEDGSSFIPWSGLLINSKTLEVQGDYTRYLGMHLRCTLTVRTRGRPGKHLKEKLCDFTRPKCHPMFFDLNINSSSVVRLNVYQAFLLCAMKFHCYLQELSDFFRPRRTYCLKIIVKSFRYMHGLIEKQMGSVRPSLGSCSDHKHRLVRDEVEWLGLAAYIEVLNRKQARHKALLTKLRSKFYGHRITGNDSSELRYAVERSHSSSLWKIEF